jgi:hypothetical protein
MMRSEVRKPLTMRSWRLAIPIASRSDRVEFRPGLIETDSLAQLTVGVNAGVISAIREAWFGSAATDGHPHFPFEVNHGEVETRGHDTHHFVKIRAKANLTAQDSWILIKAAFPQAMPDDGDRRALRAVVALEEPAADQRLKTKQRKKVVRDIRTFDLFGFVPLEEREAGSLSCNQLFKTLGLLAPILEVRIRNGHLVHC